MRLLGIALGFALFIQLSPALADSTSDANTYSDRSITFTAPDGWTNLHAPPPDGTENSTPVAMFIKSFNKYDTRAIQIVVKDYSGSLDGFEGDHEKELRKDSDSAFIRKSKVTLANGMPAYWLKVTQGADAGSYVALYEYVIVDLKRAITVAYIGKQGFFDEKDAQTSLAQLAVVAYPAR
jgi:hypothetical protein